MYPTIGTTGKSCTNTHVIGLGALGVRVEELTAGQLLNAMMITSGTMTNRIDRLEHRGFVGRRRDPDDGRVVLVALTPAGRHRVDAALQAHAANELNIISALSQRDRSELIRVLRRLHLSLDPDHQNPTGGRESNPHRRSDSKG